MIHSSSLLKLALVASFERIYLVFISFDLLFLFLLLMAPPKNKSKPASSNSSAISPDALQDVISSTVRAVVAELRTAEGHRSDRPIWPIGDTFAEPKLVSDPSTLAGGSLSSKGPSFQRPGNQEQYNSLSAISKCVEDTIIALERGFDRSLALASAKNAKLLLENRVSKLILADRVGSWSVVERVCDDTASYVTDPAAKKALDKWDLLQGRQLFRGTGVGGGPSKRRFFEKSSYPGVQSRPRSRSRSPVRQRPNAFFSRSTSQRRPSSDDQCYKCGEFGHWAPNCPSDGAGNNTRLRSHARVSGRSGFANERR